MTDTQIVEQHTIALDWQKRHERFIEELAVLLSPCIADESAVKGSISTLLDVEEKLRVKEKELEKEHIKHGQEAIKWKEELKELQAELDKQGKTNTLLRERVLKAEAAIEQYRITIGKTVGFKKFISSLFPKG